MSSYNYNQEKEYVAQKDMTARSGDKDGMQSELHRIFNIQKDQIDEMNSIIDRLLSRVSRLDHVCNRINSVNYPKNFKSVSESDRSGPVSSMKPSEPEYDGIMGLFKEASMMRSSQIELLNANIINNLDVALDYLDTYI